MPRLLPELSLLLNEFSETDDIKNYKDINFNNLKTIHKTYYLFFYLAKDICKKNTVRIFNIQRNKKFKWVNPTLVYYLN